MSSYQNANWMKRLWGLAAPGKPGAEFVQNVNLVNDGAYRSSRERAPYARHFGLMSAAGAGSHTVLEIRAADSFTALPAIALLHHLLAVPSTGLLAMQLADPAGLTFASRTLQTPLFRDRDAELTPEVRHCVMTTANLPANGALVPNNAVITNLDPQGLPFAMSWDDGRSLFVWSATDNAQLIVDVCFQAMRA